MLTYKTDSLSSTVLIQKINNLEYKIDNLTEKSNISLYVPIVVALITAVIGSFATQIVVNIITQKQNKEKGLRECNSKCVNYKIRLKDLFLELLKKETLIYYWWHCANIGNDKDKKDLYYSEHLKAISDKSRIKEKISEITASFLLETTQYEKLFGKKFNADSYKKVIENIEFPSLKRPDLSLDNTRAKQYLAEQENNLKADYLNKLEPFTNIIDSMKF